MSKPPPSKLTHFTFQFGRQSIKACSEVWVWIKSPLIPVYPVGSAEGSSGTDAMNSVESPPSIFYIYILHLYSDDPLPGWNLSKHFPDPAQLGKEADSTGDKGSQDISPSPKQRPIFHHNHWICLLLSVCYILMFHTFKEAFVWDQNLWLTTTCKT